MAAAVLALNPMVTEPLAGIVEFQEAGVRAYPPATAVADPFQALVIVSGVERLALQLVTPVEALLLRTRLAT